MPEHIRALIVILALSIITLRISNKFAESILTTSAFSRWKKLWIAITIIAFISHNFWIYLLASFLLISFSLKNESSRLGLFYALLFTIPAASAQIPGFGVVNYLFSINHIRLLSLAILLPTALDLWRDNRNLAFFRTTPDKILFIYLIIIVSLKFRETSFTDTIRYGFEVFIDIFLPYFVASRYLKNINGFNSTLLGFLIAAMILALIGFFEYARHWLLYNSLIGAMGLEWGFSHYLGRTGSLRASATTGQAIALGYVMVVSIGFFLHLKSNIYSRVHRRLFGLLLAIGLFVPLSRGPWLGVAALFVAYISTGDQAIRRLFMLVMATILTLPLLLLIPGGKQILDLLPFMGKVEQGNVDFRGDLLQVAIIVIQKNPWFGSVNFLSDPEFDPLRQGTGFVDLVNTYLSVALEFGLIGLGLFIGFFTVVLLGIRKAMQSLPDRDDATYSLGRSLLATLFGILVIIFTVSSITIIPVVYWSVAGLGVAYAQMVRDRIKAA